MIGLARTGASFLLNLEGLATVGIAGSYFGRMSIVASY
jgi:hypothetical protein